MGNLSGGAFLGALSGIVIVFMMLAILCLMIPVISKIVQSVQRPAVRERVATTQKAASAAAPAPAPAVTAVSGDVKLIDVDEKTAACIMAIVSHETGIPLSELIFKTIKAL